MNWDTLFSFEEENETIKLAYYVIDYCKKHNLELTNLKLQKLLYFINIEYLKSTAGQPIFAEEFLAWRHGPVLQSAYNFFKIGIVETTPEKMNIIKTNYDVATRNIIDSVLKKKAKMNAWDLVNETHQDNSPWCVIFHKGLVNNNTSFNRIPHELIYTFYKNN